MKVYVDLSVFVGDETALGMVSGDLELAFLPPIGSSIAFTTPLDGVGPVEVPGFNGLVKVENLLLHPMNDRVSVAAAVFLADVVVRSKHDGKAVMDYLERGFGLMSVEY